MEKNIDLSQGRALDFNNKAKEQEAVKRQLQVKLKTLAVDIAVTFNEGKGVHRFKKDYNEVLKFFESENNLLKFNQKLECLKIAVSISKTLESALDNVEAVRKTIAQ